MARGKKYYFNEDLIIRSLYRPFFKKQLYYSKELNEMQYQIPSMFPTGKENNTIISFNVSSSKSFLLIAANSVVDLHFVGDSQCIPFYKFDKSGGLVENVTDWGLNQFVKRYGKKVITKETIFQYVYAVLHNPAYLKKYELNLKRELQEFRFMITLSNGAIGANPY